MEFVALQFVVSYLIVETMTLLLPLGSWPWLIGFSYCNPTDGIHPEDLGKLVYVSSFRSVKLPFPSIIDGLVHGLDLTIDLGW